eukprot:TRINITY_DN470_c1_g2_i6.p1 TRINITY_DN470_c1_g2~~TRINITY_DN470_c1_g2_i6.p1  ORF type:complete len:622 (-),score=72.57 TRINITY_DN470_c1_g2_i6:407-2272(-)
MMEKTTKCHTHDLELKYYCKNSECNTFVCRKCLNQHHQGHPMVHVKDYMLDKIKAIEVNMDELNTFLKNDTATIAKVKKEYLEFMKLIENKKNEVRKAIREEAEKRLARWEEYNLNLSESISKRYNNFMESHVNSTQKIKKELAFLGSACALTKQCYGKEKPYSKFVELYKTSEWKSTVDFIRFADKGYYSGIISDISKASALHVERQRQTIKAIKGQGELISSEEHCAVRVEEKIQVLKRALDKSLTEAEKGYEDLKTRYNKLIEINTISAQDIERMLREIQKREAEKAILEVQLEKLNKELRAKEKKVAVTEIVSKQADQIAKLDTYIKEALTEINVSLTKIGKDTATSKSTDEVVKEMAGVLREVRAITSVVKEEAKGHSGALLNISDKIKGVEKKCDDSTVFHTENFKRIQERAEITAAKIEMQSGLIQTLQDAANKIQTICLQIKDAKSFGALEESLEKLKVIALRLPIANSSMLTLHQFTSEDQIYGTADCINKRQFISKNIGYTGSQFHFDSGQGGKYIAFNMSKSPAKICKMKMWSSNISNNVYNIEYSKDNSTWTKHCDFKQDSGWSKHLINVAEGYPYWRVMVTTHGGNTPWYCIEWYKLKEQLLRFIYHK